MSTKQPFLGHEPFFMRKFRDFLRTFCATWAENQRFVFRWSSLSRPAEPTNDMPSKGSQGASLTGRAAAGSAIAQNGESDRAYRLKATG